MPGTNRLLFVALALSLLGCARDGDSTFAPTGAKGVTDEFGRTVYLDEECGGLDSPDYPDFFQNALFRDGAPGRGRLWLVDGGHLWSAPLPASPDSDVTVSLEVPLVGRGNAVAATEQFIALAIVGHGVIVYPDYDFDHPVWIDAFDRPIDVDAVGDRLALAAGDKGVHFYDVSDPRAPVPKGSIDTDGFASGVRWGRAADKNVLYFSACRRVGYATFADDASTTAFSELLGHANAKDAHGNGERMAVANNGGGVWFFEMKGMAHSATYEVNDPNFYANAAWVEDEFVYVAAGNREIVGLWIFGDYEAEPKPVAVLPKDPLGIVVEQDTVYGFGNFRDIGERTVVRTAVLDGTPPSVSRFESGLLAWLEPRGYAIWSTDSAGNEWLARREVGGYSVYRAGPLDVAWTHEPGFKFFARAGTYAVSVTADNRIVLASDGVTETTVLAAWPEPFPPRGYVLLEVMDGEAVISLQAGTPRSWLLSNPAVAIGGAFEQFYNVDCRFENFTEEGGFSRTFIGKRFVGDDQRIEWCSRLADPFVSGNRPENDVGTNGHLCVDGLCYLADLHASGVVGILPLSGERYVSLVDDRTAYTTSILVWQPRVNDDFVAETSWPRVDDDARFIASEAHRYVRLGRPEGWEPLADGAIRVWMTDGSAFTYDADENVVYDELLSLDW